MRDDIAFRTQEWASDLHPKIVAPAQRMVTQAAGEAGAAVASFVQQNRAAELQFQQMEMEKARSVEEINTSQIRRAQAQEALDWAQRLHGNDMLEIQKKSAAATLRLQEAQVEKALEDLRGHKLDKFSRLAKLSPQEMAYMRSELGIDATIRGGKIEIVEASPEMRKSARAELEKYESERLSAIERDKMESAARIKAYESRGARQPETAQQTMRDYYRLLEKSSGADAMLWTPEHRQRVNAMMNAYREKLTADGIDLDAFEAQAAKDISEAAGVEAGDDEPLWKALAEDLLRDAGAEPKK